MSSQRIEHESVLCARCARELRSGSGNLYRITIEAVADPDPQHIADDSTSEQLRRQIEETIAMLENTSAREALDQVHRRLVLYLCTRCFRSWIENPVN